MAVYIHQLEIYLLLLSAGQSFLTNQKIYFLKENLKEKYKKYMDKGRQIQNVFLKDELMSIGIHNNERSVK